MRRVFLWAARNRWLKEHLPRFGFMRRAVRRFMPGETIDDALAAAAPLQAAGIGTMYTRLGENLESLAEADEVAAHYTSVIDRIKAAGIDGEISVKPTQLGLDHDADACLAHLERLAAYAAANGSYLWIDMEGSAYTDATIEIYERLRATQPRRPGSASRRTSGGRPPTSNDCSRSIRPSAWSRAPTTNRRRSPTGTSGEVDSNYAALAVRFLLDGRGRSIRLGLGTHDVTLIEQIAASVAPAGVGRTRLRRRDALRHPDRSAVPSGQGGLSGRGAHRVRRRLVSVVHASPRGATGQRDVRDPIAAAVGRRPTMSTVSSPRIAARMRTIGTETAFEVGARARALEAQGRSIIHLQIGEPDFDTPANVRDGGEAGARRGRHALRAVRRHPRAARGDRRRCQRPQGLRRGPVAGVRDRRRQGRDATTRSWAWSTRATR